MKKDLTAKFFLQLLAVLVFFIFAATPVSAAIVGHAEGSDKSTTSIITISCWNHMCGISWRQRPAV